MPVWSFYDFELIHFDRRRWSFRISKQIFSNYSTLLKVGYMSMMSFRNHSFVDFALVIVILRENDF